MLPEDAIDAHKRELARLQRRERRWRSRQKQCARTLREIRRRIVREESMLAEARRADTAARMKRDWGIS